MSEATTFDIRFSIIYTISNKHKPPLLNEYFQNDLLPTVSKITQILP